MIFFFKPQTAYAMRISDWSSDVCSSDLQTAEDHGIGDVGDVKLIEAKQPCLVGKRLRDLRDGIAVLLPVLVLAPAMNRLVHLDHEFVEMDEIGRAHV